MKSLQKTFDLLEYVFLQNGASVTPSEAAEALEINLVTATRILGSLVQRGYLIKVSRKDGYAPGPMIMSLGTRRNSFQRLARAARQPIKELSNQLNRQVNLSVLNENRRVMLCFQLNGNYTEPWNKFFFNTHYYTGTGRCLLAALDFATARKLTDEVVTPEELKQELSAIASRGYARFEAENEVVIGHLIQVPGLPAAALGFGVARENADEALKLSSQTVKNIIDNLKNNLRDY